MLCLKHARVTLAAWGLELLMLMLLLGPFWALPSTFAPFSFSLSSWYFSVSLLQCLPGALTDALCFLLDCGSDTLYSPLLPFSLFIELQDAGQESSGIAQQCQQRLLKHCHKNYIVLMVLLNVPSIPYIFSSLLHCTI